MWVLHPWRPAQTYLGSRAQHLYTLRAVHLKTLEAHSPDFQLTMRGIASVEVSRATSELRACAILVIGADANDSVL